MEKIKHSICFYDIEYKTHFGWLLEIPFRLNKGDEIDLSTLEILGKTTNKGDDLERLHQDFFDCNFFIDWITIEHDYSISCFIKLV